MDNKVISPCISICKTDPITGYCYGCARTNEEKGLWKDEKTDEKWKQKNLQLIKMGICTINSSTTKPYVFRCESCRKLCPAASATSQMKANYVLSTPISKSWHRH